MALAWAAALAVSIAAVQPFVSYLRQPGISAARQVVETLDAGTLNVPGAIAVEGSFRPGEFGWDLPGGTSGAITYTVEKPAQLGLNVECWTRVGAPGLPGKISVALGAGTYFSPGTEVVSDHLRLLLPDAGRGFGRVRVRLEAANQSSAEQLVLDQLQWTAYRGSEVEPPSNLALAGLGLLVGVLTLPFLRPRRSALAVAAILGALTAAGAATRLAAVQLASVNALDPDAGAFRDYGLRFQWWPPSRGIFCGCYGDREPFYPMLAHGWFSLWGASDFHLRTLSLCLSLLMVVMAAVAARRLLAWPLALAVAAAIAFNGPLAAESARGLRTELEGVLVLAVFLAFTRSAEGGAVVEGVLAGAASVALTLTRTFFIPVIGAATLVGTVLGPGSWRRRLVVAGIALAIPAIGIAGHRIGLYETPYFASFSPVHSAFHDQAGYIRWLANYEKYVRGYPLPHPELFPTADELAGARNPLYAGPPLSTWQYFFVLHTPYEVLRDTLSGYVAIWHTWGGLSLPTVLGLVVAPRLDAAARWFGLVGLVGLVATARSEPRRLLIPGIVVVGLAFVAFPYARGLIETYRNVMQIYPLVLIAGGWALEASAAALLERRPDLRPAALLTVGDRRQLVAVGMSTASFVATGFAVSVPLANTRTVAAAAAVAVLTLGLAAALEPPAALAGLLVSLCVAGARLGLALEAVVAAALVATQWRVARAAVTGAAPFLPLAVALAIGGGLGTAWHASVPALEAGSGVLFLAGGAAIASGGVDAARRVATAWVIAGSVLAVLSLGATALQLGALALGPTSGVAAMLAPPVVLAAWLWQPKQRLPILGGALALTAATMAAPVLGLLALLGALLVVARGGWPWRTAAGWLIGALLVGLGLRLTSTFTQLEHGAAVTLAPRQALPVVAALVIAYALAGWRVLHGDDRTAGIAVLLAALGVALQEPMSSPAAAASVVGALSWAALRRSARPERTPTYTPGRVNDRNLREREHFDQLADELDTVWWGSVTPAGRVRQAERAEIAIHHAGLEPGKLVLEPGAGNGEFTLRLAPSGATIVGVEISPKQVRLAEDVLRDFPEASVVVGDVDHLNFPDQHFDAVVGQSVLHHFDLELALPELYRVLKPGGRMFFLEPNMLNPQVALERNVPAVGRRLQNSPDETAFFRWQVSRALRDHGFRNVWTKPFDFLHPATPKPLIPLVHRTSQLLSRVPAVREIAGSLQIYAER